MSLSDQPPRWPWLQFPLLHPFAFHPSLQKCRLALMVAYKRVPAHPHHHQQHHNNNTSSSNNKNNTSNNNNNNNNTSTAPLQYLRCNLETPDGHNTNFT